VNWIGYWDSKHLQLVDVNYVKDWTCKIVGITMKICVRGN
jgi:hypothetical protein